MNAEWDQTLQSRIGTVLVVEDEVLTRMMIAETLREAGLVVVEAGNADEAMAYIKGGAAVDLVFADIEMPGAMDGAVLARRLRAEFPGIKVMLTSGGSRTPETTSIAPFVSKPYDLGAVVAQISRALTEPPPK